MKTNKEIKSLTFHFTDIKISEFCLLTKDHNKLHCSDSFAKESGYEGGRIVNGAFILSISNSLVANHVGNGCLIISQEAKFLSPCYSGNYYRFYIESIQEHLGGNFAEYKVIVNSLDTNKIILSKIKYLVKLT